MKIKIRLSGEKIIAIPIISSMPPSSTSVNTPRGRRGIPPAAGPRIRKAVHELGPDANFSTVLLDECPTPQIINRIRTHLDCDAVGVIEFGIKNGWHLHIVHLRSLEDAKKILSNYGEVHSRKIDSVSRTAWYLTKSIGIMPPSEHPKSWYFCSRHLGKDEVFYIDSTVLEVCAVGQWVQKDFYLITDRTYTTVAYLKNLPRWIPPPEEISPLNCNEV